MNGDLEIELIAASPTSALGKQWSRYSNRYLGTDYEIDDDPAKEVGPYRSAALWEIIGQTFEKGERIKRAKSRSKSKRRERVYKGDVGDYEGLLNFEAAVLDDVLEEEEEFSGM